METRDTPASFSALLSGGAVVSGSFTTPSGVDAAQASQVVELTDLSAVRGGVSYTAAPVPLAYYSYGALTGVAANLFSPDDQIDLYSNGTAVFTPASGPAETGGIAYDVTDAQATFTLSDGTVGSISYQIPWSQVDPSQSSQSLTPTAFNLNIAGQNFAYGTANYTTAPTLAFANGDLTGFTFSLTPPQGFAYTSLTGSFDVNGNNIVTAVQAGTGQQFVAAPVPQEYVRFDFSSIATGRAYTIVLTFANGSNKEMASISVSVLDSDSASDIANNVATAINGTSKFAATVNGTDVQIKALATGRGWSKLTYANVGGIWTPTLTGPTLTKKQVVSVVGSQVVVP